MRNLTGPTDQRNDPSSPSPLTTQSAAELFLSIHLPTFFPFLPFTDLFFLADQTNSSLLFFFCPLSSALITAEKCDGERERAHHRGEINDDEEEECDEKGFIYSFYLNARNGDNGVENGAEGRRRWREEEGGGCLMAVWELWWEKRKNE